MANQTERFVTQGDPNATDPKTGFLSDRMAAFALMQRKRDAARIEEAAILAAHLNSTPVVASVSAEDVAAGHDGLPD